MKKSAHCAQNDNRSNNRKCFECVQFHALLENKTHIPLVTIIIWFNRAGVICSYHARYSMQYGGDMWWGYSEGSLVKNLQRFRNDRIKRRDYGIFSSIYTYPLKLVQMVWHNSCLQLTFPLQTTLGNWKLVFHSTWHLHNRWYFTKVRLDSPSCVKYNIPKDHMR